VFARVPASSANLGPGFDALAVALGLYVEVGLEPADEFSITSTGEGAGRFDDERHLAAVVAGRVLGHQRFALRVDSQIPVSRGLGSSAALALAAAAAAGAADPLLIAARVDGHAENAAASYLGGLVVARLDADAVVARRLALDPAWRFVVVIPDEELATADARRVLPREVAYADAVANLNALGLLVAGLASREDYVAGAMSDRLHQPYRETLLTFAPDLLATLREAGAADACWSGAGSTMLGLCTPDTALAVAAAARSFLAERSIPGEVRTLEADVAGLVVA
jgi:homoserine kinase